MLASVGVLAGLGIWQALRVARTGPHGYALVLTIESHDGQLNPKLRREAGAQAAVDVPRGAGDEARGG
jgi:hypothetical protein